MKSTYVQRIVSGLLAAVMLLSAFPAVVPVGAEAAEPMFPKVLTVKAAMAGSTGSIQTADMLINGAGMSGDGLNATHDNNEGAATMWHIKEDASDPQTDTAWVQFDLGSVQQIGRIYVWNHNQNHPTAGNLTDRGLKDVKIEYSLDGASWTELRGTQADPGKDYPYTLAQATGSSAEPASNLVGGAPIEMNKLARHVKITADPDVGEGNYGSAAVYGMSEVRFAEMISTTADQDAIYGALKEYFDLYEEEYTPSSWSALEAAVADAIAVFNGGSAETESVVEALQKALEGLASSGKLHVRVVDVAKVTASSDAGGNSNINNIINGSGMSDGTLQATHTAQSGGIAAWSTSQAAGTEAWVQFDFGRLKSIGSMYVWNNNHPACVYRSLKNIRIEYSADGKNWTELRDSTQISNSGDYPYTLAKGPGVETTATNLVGGEPVQIHKMARYVKIIADPVAGQGNYWTNQGDQDYGLSEVRFGSMDEMSAEQQRIETALARLASKNSAFYTPESWAAYQAESHRLAELFGKEGLTAQETTDALTALETAEAALVQVKMEEFVCDFETTEGILPQEESVSNVEMDVTCNNGWLKLTGEQTKDGAGYAYINIISGLNLEIEKNSRLTYVISPKMDQLYNGEYPSQHVAVDLKFSDGSYLSDLGVLDDNCVGIHPNAQGESKTQIMCGSKTDATASRYVAKNLITVCLGEWEQVLGKTVTEILVGYENDNGYDNYVFETAIDEIRLKAAEKIYEKPTDYVLTTAGTANYLYNDSALGCYSFGKSAPFVALPQSFNLWSPQNVNATNQLRTIYNYEREYLKAFTCSHQANYHIGDMINWNFAVTNGGTVEDTSFDRANEIAKAHYYSVEFDKDSAGRAAGTKAELTTTEHGAALRVTYDEGLAKRGLILKGINDTITGKVSSLAIDQETDSFAAEITATIDHGIDKMYVFGTFDADITAYDDTTVYFDENAVTMKVATSFISAGQAKANYDQELKDKTFVEVCTEAEDIWLEKLGTIEIEGATETQMISFYTALYRSYLYPNHLGEYTGEGEKDGWQYRGIYGDKEIEDGKLYYNNGFWDNYRTTWPLMTLLEPEQTAEMIEGLLYHYRDDGWIPRWTSAVGMDCMCGTSTDIIFGDALSRGITLDEETLQLAYEASLKNATVITEANAAGGRDGLDEYTFLGYITDEGANETALSWALAGYYNDYGIAQIAKAVGDEDVYAYMLDRCLNYVNMFDTAHEWFRGIEEDAETEWAEDLNPYYYDGDYMESYAWIMAFDAAYDGQGLINLYGSREELEAKLDAVFNTNGDLIWDHEENRYSGVTHELLEVAQVKMGMYEHNNQPSHHIPYMYLYAGNPSKTQSTVRQILRQCYTNVQNGVGYIGDDDSGEQSAWYVLSALGLYPLNMGTGELVFGSPLFTKVTIHLDNGKDIVIQAPENSPENVYVKDVKINGVSYNKTSILQTELTENGAVIEFDMTDEPSDWGTGADAAPTSVTTGTGVPDLLRDHTAADAAALTVAVDPLSLFESVTGGSGELFDNTADTAAMATGEILYHFSVPKNVSMITLTAADDTGKAPTAFALYGSNDGEDWTLLEQRSDLQFKWQAQTVPYKVGNTGYYTEYKLELTGELAEIELMGKAADATAQELAAAIARIEKLELSSMDAEQQIAIRKAANAAKTAETQEEITKAFLAMNTALESGVELDTARAALQVAYDTEKARNKAIYTAESYAAYEQAMETARAALTDTDATVTILRNARSALAAAVAGLKLGVDYTAALSYNKTATAVNYNAADQAAYAVDGKASTKWCNLSSAADSNGYHWLQIDLGAECTVEAWHLANAQASGDQAKFNTRVCKVQVQSSTGTWEDVDTVTENTAAYVTRVLETPVTGQVFRLLIKAEVGQASQPLSATIAYNDGHARIQEFQLFGKMNSLSYQKDTVVSGSTGSTEGGAMGVDGNAATKWCSTTSVNGYHWLQVDLGEESAVTSWTVLNAGHKENEKFITSAFTLQVQNSTGAWEDVQVVTGNTANRFVSSLSKSVAGRYFRLLIEAKVGSAGQATGDTYARIYEFQVMGESNAPSATVEAKIGAIGEVTLQSGDAIAAARLAYNDLSVTQKAMVDNYSALIAAENAYAAAEAAANDVAAAKIAEDLINAIGTVTNQSKPVIDAAAETYEALSSAQKGLVDETVLTAAKEAYAELIISGAAEATELIAAVKPFLNRASGGAIVAARKAYDALNEEQKALVEGYEAFLALEEEYNAKAAYAVGDLNGNGQAELTDVVLLLQHLVGYEVTLKTFADISNNQRISIYDAVLLLRMVNQ